MGRILFLLGAALLAATAVIHGCGQPMVDSWLQGLSEKQKLAICLVWVTDSLSWLVVGVLWAVAGFRQSWLGAAAVGALIPALTAAAILAIDPTFFGGWMLVGSVVLAGSGFALCSSRHPARSAGV